MPWNDNVKPGPWGAPPDGDDDKPVTGDSGQPSGSGPRSPWGAPQPPAGDAGGPRTPRPSTPGVGPRKRPDRPRTNPFGGGSTSGSGGGGRGGDFDKMQREWSDKARRFFRHPSGRGVRPGAVAVVAGAAVGLWALTGVYIVQPNEQAVVTRFGVYARTESPGLKVRLPWPVESVQNVAVTTLNQLNVGGAAAGADRPEESLMLTGDENIIDMDFTVTWRVSDADDYLFRVSNPDATVKAVAESAMREVVGRSQLNDVLSSGRARIQAQTEVLMQRVLDSYRAGVTVVDIQIRAAEPPREVITAFREVAGAGQEAQSAINEANTYRNRVVNEAVGSAAAIRQQAEGYRQQVVSQAEGEAARFNQVHAQYQANPGVTRERLYLETMERVLRDSNKVVVDTGGQGGATAPIILPPEVFRQGGARTAPTAPAPATPSPQAQAQAGAAQ